MSSAKEIYEMLYQKDLENPVCTCECHEKAALHCVPCCHECSVCKKNIKARVFTRHKDSCQG